MGVRPSCYPIGSVPYEKEEIVSVDPRARLAVILMGFYLLLLMATCVLWVRP